MRLIYKLLCIACTLLLTFSLRASVKTADTAFLPCLAAADGRLNEAFNLMEKHYYKKGETKWQELRTAAREKLAKASSCDEAMQAINWCFSQLGEPHSFIMPPASAAVYTNDRQVLTTPPTMYQVMGEMRSYLYEDKGVAYLSLPWINTMDSALCTRIADSIQGVIANLDKSGVKKWIIDLRNNRGGNCWPMIAGIGPLLGNGVCGYFVTADDKVAINYQDGAAMHGRYTRCRVSGKPYKLSSREKSLVVLTGPKTSSSGEIIAMAFKGQKNTFLYGQPTAGLTTANTTYNLSDRSMLVLTVCREADRNGRLVEGRIQPDQMFAEANAESDAALDAAVMWLHVQ